MISRALATTEVWEAVVIGVKELAVKAATFSVSYTVEVAVWLPNVTSVTPVPAVTLFIPVPAVMFAVAAPVMLTV